MTIGKTVRILTALMLAVCLICFASCASSDGNALELLAALSDDSGGNGSVRYRVVISGMCSGRLSTLAHSLAEGIESVSGAETCVVYDSDETTERLGMTELVLGYTERACSRELLSRLNRDDYVCAFASNGSLVIGGKSDSATVTAVERFIEEILPYSDSEMLLSADGGFEYFYEYERSALSLCGFGVSDYTLVCPEGRRSEAALIAELFRERTADICGAYPDIVYGRTPVDGKKEIVFSVDSELREGCAAFEAVREDIVLSACDSYGLSLSASELYALMLDGDGAELDGKRQLSYSTRKLSVMSVALDATANYGLDTVLELQEKIKSEMPDVVVLGRIKENLWDMIAPNLPTEYGVEEILSDGAECINVLYRRELFDVKSNSCDADKNIFRLMFSETDGDGELCLAGNTGDENERLYKNVEDIFLANDCHTVFVLIAPEKAERTLSTVTQGAAAAYDLTLTIGRLGSHYALLASYPALTCETVAAEYGTDKSVGFVSVNVGMRWCKAFCTLAELK